MPNPDPLTLDDVLGMMRDGYCVRSVLGPRRLYWWEGDGYEGNGGVTDAEQVLINARDHWRMHKEAKR